MTVVFNVIPMAAVIIVLFIVFWRSGLLESEKPKKKLTEDMKRIREKILE